MERARGFTLLEVIVVLVIVAVLAVMAIMAYDRYVFRAHRTDAHQALMMIANGEERWYATHNRYTDDLAELGFADPAISMHGYYELVLELGGDTAQSFTAIAMPLRVQARDLCGNLSIDNKGSKLPMQGDVEANANGRCW
jgi:type IV pilus assembly protein PilE